MSTKITVTLTGKAEKMYNEIMYSLPENEDGSGMCTQSQAVNYAFKELALFEQLSGGSVTEYAKNNFPEELIKFNNGNV